MPSIIDGSASATFATPLPLLQGGTGNTSGNVVSSQVAGALNATGSAPLYACRAWVSFNGTGTVAIRASGNVSSITDNDVGVYNVNFATAMPDTNYSAVGSAVNTASGKAVASTFSRTSTTILQVSTGPNLGGGANEDSAFVSVVVFR